jgi:hypothetical protein
MGARGSVVCWGTMLQAERLRDRIPITSLNFSFGLILPAALWSWFDSASNKNEYQEFSWGGGEERQARKADNLNAIYEPTV